jgi:hypothetical protein
MPPLVFSWSISPLLLKGRSRTMRLCDEGGREREVERGRDREKGR